MNTSSVYIHSISAPGFSGSVPELHEGSFVSVRVISRQTDGKYQLSFAGQRFLADSTFDLKSGSVFKAQVLLKNGMLTLVPQKINSTQDFSVKNIIVENNSANLQILQNPELSAFFSSLGLVPDSLTLRIFQQLQQLGARIDLKLFSKVRQAALRFPGRELSAGEAALLLEEKGIEATDDAVQKILNYSENDGKNENSRKFQFKESDGKPFSDNSEKHNLNRPNPDKIESSSCDEFRQQIFDSDSAFYKTHRKNGLISLFNQLKNSSGNNSHWIILPYEFVQGDVKTGYGAMRLCCETQKKSVKKIILSGIMRRQLYTFVVYFSDNNKLLTDIMFSLDPVPSGGIAKTIELLKSFVNADSSVNIEWIQNEVTPFYTENTPLSFAGGLV